MMQPEKKQFSFGVTYYPDQWPRSTWKENFSKIKAAGFNIVRFGEMAWDWIEPSEKRFEWAGPDYALELAEKNGIDVILGIATSQVPVWMIKKYPELRPVSNTGSVYPEYGPRPNVCRDSETYRSLAERYITSLVDRYRKHKALRYWQLDNEPVYPPLDSTTQEDYCHCQATQKLFRAWARKKYLTLKSLNQAWGTRFWTNSFNDWAEVVSPKCGVWDAGNPHIFLDWYRFKSDSIHSWLLWMRDIVKKLDSAHRVGTNGFLGVSPRMLDLDLLAEGLDWFGWDIYPRGSKASPIKLAQMSDWWRGFTSGRPSEFHITELQGGPNVRWGYPGYVDKLDIKLWTHQLVAHGAEVLLYHNWLTPVFGGETGGFGLVEADGTPTERLRSVTHIAEKIKELGLGIKGKSVNSSCAIVYLYESDAQTYQEIGPPRALSGQWEAFRGDLGIGYSLSSLEGAYRLLWNDFTPVDFIFKRHLDKGIKALSGYKTIILPNPYVLSDRWIKELDRYVSSGGILITESRFGKKDRMGHLTVPPPIRSFLGLDYRHTVTIDEGEELGIRGLGRACGFLDIIGDSAHFKGGILKYFTDGRPALIEIRRGKGRILYASFSLCLSAMREDNSRLIRYIKSYIKTRARIPENFRTNSSETEIIYRGSYGVYIINHGPNISRVRIKVPRSGYAREMIEGKKIKYSKGWVRLNVPAGDVRFVSFV